MNIFTLLNRLTDSHKSVVGLAVLVGAVLGKQYGVLDDGTFDWLVTGGGGLAGIGLVHRAAKAMKQEPAK